MQPNSSLSRPGRHLTEKNRRQQMKGLYSQLASLVSAENSLEKSPALDVLDKATNYIKQLETNINELKARKESLQLPVVIDVNESEAGETLEINIVCGSEKKLKMHKVLGILREAGAEVVSASNCIVGFKICHTIVCKAFSSRLGMDTAKLQECLDNFMSGT